MIRIEFPYILYDFVFFCVGKLDREKKDKQDEEEEEE